MESGGRPDPRSVHDAPVNDPAPLPDDLRGTAFSRTDARRAGVPQGRLRRRDIRRPFHGVQIVGTVGGLHERCRAYLVRMKGQQAFSHQTAVLLHGLPLPRAFEEELDLHVCAIMPAPVPTTRGVVGHRIRIRPELVPVGGLPVVDMVEAWAQMAPLLAVDELIELGDAVLWRDPELLPAMRRAAAVPYRPGAPSLKKALKEIRIGSRSPGETRVRLLLTRAGIPEPELNAPVRSAFGDVHPDLVWRGHRVLLEYEGSGHGKDRQYRRDIERYEDLREAGWTVVRASDDDLHGDAARTLIRRVRALLA